MARSHQSPDLISLAHTRSNGREPFSFPASETEQGRRVRAATPSPEQREPAPRCPKSQFVKVIRAEAQRELWGGFLTVISAMYHSAHKPRRN
jgi:hypothetical protein